MSENLSKDAQLERVKSDPNWQPEAVAARALSCRTPEDLHEWAWREMSHATSLYEGDDFIVSALHWMILRCVGIRATAAFPTSAGKEAAQ